MSREGIVPLLKPPGLSSSDCVVDVRRLFGEKRVGHLGTLDPGAAGILPVCVGRAVRLFDYLVDKDKTYRFELLLGTATDTQDSFGQVIEMGERDIPADALEAAIKAEGVSKKLLEKVEEQLEKHDLPNLRSEKEFLIGIKNIKETIEKQYYTGIAGVIYSMYFGKHNFIERQKLYYSQILKGGLADEDA